MGIQRFGYEEECVFYHSECKGKWVRMADLARGIQVRGRGIQVAGEGIQGVFEGIQISVRAFSALAMKKSACFTIPNARGSG